MKFVGREINGGGQTGRFWNLIMKNYNSVHVCEGVWGCVRVCEGVWGCAQVRLRESEEDG